MKDYSLKNGVKGSDKDVAIDQYPKSYIIWLVIAVLIFIPTLIIAHKHQLSGFQLSIFRDLNNLSNSFKTPALVLTEGLGAGYAIAICIVIAAAFKRYKLAWRFFVAAGAAGVLLEIAKKVAKEPRPAALLHGHLHVRAVETGLNSYPSGHQTMATALALTLWLVLPKKWRWVCILWLVVVAVSRIYVGDHTPNDVLGGFACGLIVICIIRLLPQKFARKVHLDTNESLSEKGF
jgi:membrane-associated phospholipid phosphatase